MAEASGLPGRHAIEGYGAGGFRFGGMSHRGSILALPSGVYPWGVLAAADVNAASLERVFAEGNGIDHLLVGLGPDFGVLAPAVVQACRARKIVPDPMSTSAAARTFNVLLAEGRRVAAALIAAP